MEANLNYDDYKAIAAKPLTSPTQRAESYSQEQMDEFEDAVRDAYNKNLNPTLAARNWMNAIDNKYPSDTEPFPVDNTVPEQEPNPYKMSFTDKYHAQGDREDKYYDPWGPGGEYDRE